MTRSKIFAFVAIAMCATSALADSAMQPLMLLAAGGHERSFRGNDFNPRQNDQNAETGNDQRQRREAAPSRERNEGFGYGFERRQERSDRPDFGRRGRN